MRYTAKFKEGIVRKLVGPNSVSLSRVASETGLSTSTLWKWREEAKTKGVSKHNSKSKPRRWTPEEKMRVLLAAAAAGESGRGELLRREGLHDADLERFQQDLVGSGRPKRDPADKKRISELEKNLRRKDKALAEATALVVLSKKLNAYFEEVEVGDTTDESET